MRSKSRLRCTVLSLVAAALSWTTPVAGQHVAAFDHGPFDRLLRAHVTHDGLVDYDAFEASSEFATYLRSLAAADVATLHDAERLALWINAYNAYTIELVNSHDERGSIRNINKRFGLFALRGPWRERLAEVGGSAYTLDEIEHDIIREEFDEPRIHFALVCAAMGCPPLRREAYSGGSLDGQLEEQATRFLTGDLGKNRVDVEDGKVHLSPIFDWYRDDFPEGDDGLGAFLAPYFSDSDTIDFLLAGDFDVEHTHYDWSLNLNR